MKAKIALKYRRKYNLILIFMLLICSASAGNELDRVLSRMAKLDSEPVQISALQGLKDGLRGIKSIKEPAAWEAIYTKLSQSKDEKMKTLLRELSTIFGSEAALQDSLILLMDDKRPLLEREAVM